MHLINWTEKSALKSAVLDTLLCKMIEYGEERNNCFSKYFQLHEFLRLQSDLCYRFPDCVRECCDMVLSKHYMNIESQLSYPVLTCR